MWKNEDWLNAGGAKIVLEVVRRMGWTVKVLSVEEWSAFGPALVAFGNREKNNIRVNGGTSLWLQAVATVAIAFSRFKHPVKCSYTDYCLPLFHAGELLDKCEAHEINNFIDAVRYSSEATILLMVSANGA